MVAVIPTLRIATLNFLAGGSDRRNTHWSLLRERLHADILLTQECRPDAGALGGCTRLWSEAGSGRWGSGLVVTHSNVKPISIAPFDGWVTGGELDRSAWLTDRPFRVFSIHCPAGDHGYVRTMHEILDALRGVAQDADLVLGGDFNVATGYRGDDEQVKMSRAEKILLDRLGSEFDLIACWQAANPGVPLAQTLRWTGNRAAPYHCDGIFIPRAWQGRLQSCDVISGPEWDALSDHNPVLAVLASGQH